MRSGRIHLSYKKRPTPSPSPKIIDSFFRSGRLLLSSSISYHQQQLQAAPIKLPRWLPSSSVCRRSPPTLQRGPELAMLTVLARLALAPRDLVDKVVISRRRVARRHISVLDACSSLCISCLALLLTTHCRLLQAFSPPSLPALRGCRWRWKLGDIKLTAAVVSVRIVQNSLQLLLGLERRLSAHIEVCLLTFFQKSCNSCVMVLDGKK